MKKNIEICYVLGKSPPAPTSAVHTLKDSISKYILDNCLLKQIDVAGIGF